jgi:hypothetical protein
MRPLTEQEGFEPPSPVRIKRFSKPSLENPNHFENNDLADTQNRRSSQVALPKTLRQRIFIFQVDMYKLREMSHNGGCELKSLRPFTQFIEEAHRRSESSYV